MMNQRLIAQSGTFLVPGTLHMPVEEILGHHYSRPRNLLMKLVLPVDSVREQAMRTLYRMNITNASLFPDLDGLARSIAYELELEWRGAQRR